MYKEMRSLNPRLCHKMRLKIMDALLEEVYVTKGKCLEKSRILIEKGRELRADGITQLHESVQCLSGAISTLVSHRYIILALAASICLPLLSWFSPHLDVIK